MERYFWKLKYQTFIAWQKKFCKDEHASATAAPLTFYVVLSASTKKPRDSFSSRSKFSLIRSCTSVQDLFIPRKRILYISCDFSFDRGASNTLIRRGARLPLIPLSSMASRPMPLNRGDFRVAILCALSKESDVAVAMFDKPWKQIDYGKADGDPNSYDFGRIGVHDVVVATMGRMGPNVSSSVAQGLRSSFDRVRLGLVVGICGAVPLRAENDLKGAEQQTRKKDDYKEVLLGDVVISTALVELGFGRQYPDKVVEKKTLEDQLGRAPQEIASFLAGINRVTARRDLKKAMVEHLTTFLKDNDFRSWCYPGANNDILYPASYRHKHHDPGVCDTCAQCMSNDNEVCLNAIGLDCEDLHCDTQLQVERTRLLALRAAELQQVPTPEIHLGRVGSGSTVMKSSFHRDSFARAEKLIAYEMEGAGVWDKVPTVIVKGVCDYADTHKNKLWQEYAAAVAMACAKGLLEKWSLTDDPSYRYTTSAGTSSS
jgi:nucleoside phosphorylase